LSTLTLTLSPEGRGKEKKNRGRGEKSSGMMEKKGVDKGEVIPSYTGGCFSHQ